MLAAKKLLAECGGVDGGAAGDGAWDGAAADEDVDRGLHTRGVVPSNRRRGDYGRGRSRQALDHHRRDTCSFQQYDLWPACLPEKTTRFFT
jgi:hypothetical protein